MNIPSSMAQLFWIKALVKAADVEAILPWCDLDRRRWWCIRTAARVHSWRPIDVVAGLLRAYRAATFDELTALRHEW